MEENIKEFMALNEKACEVMGKRLTTLINFVLKSVPKSEREKSFELTQKTSQFIVDEIEKKGSKSKIKNISFERIFLTTAFLFHNSLMHYIDMGGILIDPPISEKSPESLDDTPELVYEDRQFREMMYADAVLNIVGLNQLRESLEDSSLSKEAQKQFMRQAQKWNLLDSD